MILVVGGAFQGKLSFALDLTGYQKEDFLDGADCDWDSIFTSKGIYHFQEYIRRCIQDGRSCEKLAERIRLDNPDVVIVTQEMGCGIVPFEPFDRKWRENTGRICTELAKEADKVYRVVCGVGMVIKDDSKN